MSTDSKSVAAEDAGKMDQYTRCDEKFDPSFKLHSNLFAASKEQHQGNLHWQSLHSAADMQFSAHSECTSAAACRSSYKPGTRSSLPRCFKLPALVQSLHLQVVETGAAVTVKRFCETGACSSCSTANSFFPQYLVAYQRKP